MLEEFKLPESDPLLSKKIYLEQITGVDCPKGLNEEALDAAISLAEETVDEAMEVLEQGTGGVRYSGGRKVILKLKTA